LSRTLIKHYKSQLDLLKPVVQHEEFMKYCWLKSQDDPLIVGYHTRKICSVIDKAITRFNAGETVFIRIKVHQRAGKSDIVSRYLPAHFVGLFPDKEVMAVSYSATMASNFSLYGRRIMQSGQYQTLFPNVRLSQEKKSASGWHICQAQGDKLTETGGRVYASGLVSGLTGSGYHLGILDDYCASREVAESIVMRDKFWDSFTNDFLTRRANHSITIVLATQWHEDDIHGRIDRKNDPECDDYDPEFPDFELLSFPARVEDGRYEEDLEWSDWDTVNKEKKKFLFEERYSKQWYISMYSALGAYSSSAMMDCNPIPRDGGILDCSSIKFHESVTEFPMGELFFIRVWDFAHSEKKKTNKDPDYTGGTLLAYRKIGYNKELRLPIVELWVKDYVQTRQTAVKRDHMVVQTMGIDGAEVPQVIETSLDSMDGYYYLQERVKGAHTLHSINIGRINKLARCEPLVPVFEAGNVHILKGEWNAVWLDSFRRFDGSGKSHDEAVDNVTAGYKFQVNAMDKQPIAVTIG
jgi:phage terminase large subunit-like protein